MDIRFDTEYTLIFTGIEVKDSVALFAISLAGVALFSVLVQLLSVFKFKQSFNSPSTAARTSIYAVDVINSVLMMYLLMTLNGYVILVMILSQLLANAIFVRLFKVSSSEDVEARLSAEQLL